MRYNIYVTFSVYDTATAKRKVAVGCLTERQAQDVSADANSLDGVVNIRWRKCGKPRNREILEYNQYFDYKWLNAKL